MRKFNRALLGAACGAVLGAMVTPSMAQVTASLVGNRLMYFGAGGTNNVQLASLPSPDDPIAVANGLTYAGEVPHYSQHVQLDDRGRVLFFIIDGDVFDRDGYLIARRSQEVQDINSYPFIDGLVKEGRGEVVTAPVPDRCGAWYVVHSRMPTTHAPHILGFSVLDLDKPNSLFPDDEDRHGKVLDYADFFADGYGTYFDDFDLNPSSGSQGVFPNDPNPSNGPVKLKVVHVQATDRTFLLVSTGFTLAKYEMKSDGIQFLGSDPIYQNPDFAPRFQTAKGELEATINGNELIVALNYEMDHANVIPPAPIFYNLVPHIYITKLNLNSTNLAQVGVPSTIVEAEIDISNGPIGQDAMGRDIYSPGVGGLEFSSDAQRLYWVKSHPGILGDHFGGWNLTTSTPIPIPDLDISPFLDGKLERYSLVDGCDSYYMSGVRADGTPVLGTLVCPEGGEPYVWEETEIDGFWTSLCTDASLNSPDASQMDPYHLLDKHGYDDQSTAMLSMRDCCDEKHKITGFTNYAADEGYQLWTATDNPFYDLADVRIHGELRIPSGANVVANDITFNFGPGAVMVIERGAKFTSDGCVFRAGCDEPWQGIRVEGNTANHDQFYDQTAPLSQRQGWLILTEGTEISDASTGVLCGKIDENGPDPGYFGGVVRAVNTTFRNCVTGVHLLRYERRSPGGAELDNLSRFTNCSFITDEGWHNTETSAPSTFAYLDDVHGIRFQNCSFRNVDPEGYLPGSQGWGIFSFMAGFQVLGNSTTATSFENLGVGVVAFTGADETYEVDRMRFENNMYGIYDMACIAPRITRNVFHVPDMGDLPRAPVGLLLNEGMGYVVEENQFIGQSASSNIGIGFLGEQPANNQIYNNEFTQLMGGNMVAGRHKGNVPGFEYDGLQILCGDYLANTVDYSVWFLSYIRENQGEVNSEDYTTSQLAGNRWLDPAVPNASWDISIVADPLQGTENNPPLPHVDYFRHSDEVCDPISPNDYYSDIPVPEALAFNKSTSCGMGDLQPPPGPPGEVRNTYLDKAAELRSVVGQYKGTVNNGMKEEDLLKEIAKNDPPLTSYALRDVILSASPVTDIVMTAMVQRPINMDTWHMVQVLVANKPLSRAVLKAAELSEHFSPYQLDLMVGTSQSGEVLTLLRNELRVVSQQKAHYQRHVMHQLLVDSTETDRWAYLASTIGQHPDLADNYLLITGHLLNGDDRDGLDWIDSLETLGIKDTPVHDALYGMRSDIGGSWPYAGPAQEQILKDNMEGYVTGAPVARALAFQAAQTTDLPDVPLPDASKSRRFRRNKQESNTATEPAGPRFFPNPCTDHSYLVFPEEQVLPIHYRIMDPTGRVVKESSTTGSGQVFQVDLTGFAAGNYLCEIYREGVAQEVLQLVIYNR